MRLGVALRSQPAFRAAIAFIEKSVLRDLVRPDLVGKDARVRSKRDARIDERATAEPAADEHVHVRAQAHIVNRRGRPGSHVLAGDLHLVLQIGKAAGELSSKDLAAALQNGDAFTGARKP